MNVKSKQDVLVICHINESNCNGQIAKTKDVCRYLERNNFNVHILNYGKMNFFKKLFYSTKCIKKFDSIVLMPGGKRALFFYTSIIHKLKKKNSHYVAIGGWVLSLLKDRKNEKFFKGLKKFKGIYLQNIDTVTAFKNNGFENVHFISSFSCKKPLTNEEKTQKNSYYNSINEFRFCFFARVERTKGVLLACDAIKRIKEDQPYLPISLDIFGEIKDETLKSELDNIISANSFISYKGVLNDDNAIKTLSGYYCLLFPTFYRGEGTPHSIIEAYMAGLPVIASNWAYNKEVVLDHQTGVIFELYSDDLYNQILWSVNNQDQISNYSKNCFEESKKYDIDKSLSVLKKNLENF